ncbi:hypothetical protein QO014_001250 [Kaistia dalseonensis]|uniref:Secreted protein n=1 Tax=Kaistia dalseonensis TaxID=410840 RepID=A0ABU0H3I6_9HYPH|nr:hypothetical protein [Kaistia dalseonensis]
MLAEAIAEAIILFVHAVIILIDARERLGLRILRLRRGDHAKIVLGMLQIAFRHHAVARRLRIARQRHVLLGDVKCGATNLDVRAIALEGTRQRIGTLAVPSAHTFVIVIIVIILLSWSHEFSLP